MATKYLHCLACGGLITPANVSAVNDEFHKLCMNEGIRVAIPNGKYTAAELEYTWAARSPIRRKS